MNALCVGCQRWGAQTASDVCGEGVKLHRQSDVIWAGHRSVYFTVGQALRKGSVLYCLVSPSVTG